ncbi:hypothetical protein E1140_20170 [Fulvivirga lutimaris]|nr:hypothetical protein [Fulvivirga lutimaris]
MSENQFLEKFQSKTDSELERIAQDSKAYVFEARQAASIILKNRKSASPVIAAFDKEVEVLSENKKKEKLDSAKITKNIIQNLSQIPIKATAKYWLKNGNELQIRRLSGSKFQIRIASPTSALVPVTICKIIDNSKIKTYPFIYLKGFLILGVGGSIVSLILSQLKIIEANMIPMPILIVLGF